MEPEAIARLLDPFGDAFRRDPYAVFALAREHAPVVYSEETGYWIVSRYDDVRTVLQDTARFSADIATALFSPPCAAAVEELRSAGFAPVRALTDNDPPDHTRVRKLVGHLLTPARVRRLEVEIRRIAREHVEAVQRGRDVDLVSSLTSPVPALVIFMLLGVSPEWLDVVKRGSTDRVLLTCGRAPQDAQVAAAKGLGSFWRYCSDLVRERIDDPGDDLLSELARARASDGDQLNEAELRTVAYSLLFAGHETTTGLLSNATLRVISEPGAWDRLAGDPASIPEFVEEVLRHDPPVLSWRRRAKTDVAIGGTAVPAGAKLLLLLGSANRDGAVFEDGDAFVPGRPRGRDHVAFGFGAHTCIGAPLARLEAPIVLEELLTRLPAPVLRGELEVPPNILFWVPRRVVVRFPV